MSSDKCPSCGRKLYGDVPCSRPPGDTAASDTPERSETRIEDLEEGERLRRMDYVELQINRDLWHDKASELATKRDALRADNDANRQLNTALRAERDALREAASEVTDEVLYRGCTDKRLRDRINELHAVITRGGIGTRTKSIVIKPDE